MISKIVKLKKLFKIFEILKMHFLTYFPPLLPLSLFLLLASFYNLPCVADFIIDILLGSPSAEVRIFYFIKSPFGPVLRGLSGYL